jgi:hypothetical protein
MGLNYAAKLLGIDQQTQNPKYTFGMPFTNQSIDPINMLKKSALNTGVKSLMGGSSMGIALPLMAGGLGLAYLRNPLRPGSMNYNPELKGQMDYLNFNNMLGSNNSSGLTQYGPDSILSGQNVVSMFGTNDYLDQLNKYKNKYYDTMPQKRKNKLDKEIADIQDYNVQKTIEKNQLKNLQNINAGNDGGGMQTSGFSNTDGGPVSNKTGRGRKGYAQGGIASL